MSADGYFVTKQPAPIDLQEHLTFDDARSREKEFFRTEYPWTELSDLHNRLGAPNLTKELSRLLANLIDQAFVISELHPTEQI